MLAGRYRALDLTDIKGAFCGKLLADLGIDVVKIEPPDGSKERELGPFFHDQPDRERSLYWFAHNVNKRGITLNLESPDGRTLLRRLAERADFLVESFAPGYLDSFGLGYGVLSEINPRLIVTSITPFGQSGPYRDFAATDLTLLALGGLVNLNGDPDRPPVRFSVEQSFPLVGMQATAATMIAHHYRATSGRGQHVDVSMQEAILPATWMEQYYWQVSGVVERRTGTFNLRGSVALRAVFPCADGFVSWRLTVASMGQRTRALVEWMAEEEMAGTLVDVDWDGLDMNALTQKQVAGWEEIIGRFFLRHAKATLHEQALRRGIMLFPMNTALDLLRDRHLAAREVWQPVEHEHLGTKLIYPGRPYRTLSGGGGAALPCAETVGQGLVPCRVPSSSTRGSPQGAGLQAQPQQLCATHEGGVQSAGPYCRAPLLGEHNTAVYGELGLSAGDLAALEQAGVI